MLVAESHRSVGSVKESKIEGRWFDPPARPILFPKIDGRHWDRIHSSLTTVHFFDDGYVGKQPVASAEYCVEFSLKELQESMDRCAGHRDMTKHC